MEFKARREKTSKCSYIFLDKPVAMEFNQRQNNSDSGAFLLNAVERRYGLVYRMEARLHDEQ